MDTGAETYMTSTSGYLRISHPPTHSTPSHIVVCDGSLLPVTSTGSISFPTSQGPLRLSNVLVSPQLLQNIYVRQFTTENNCSVDFDLFGFSVKDLQTRKERDR